MSGVLAAATAADAGTTLLSRQTGIYAAGDSGLAGGGFNLSQSSSTFERFADQVGSDTEGSGLTSVAHQYSVPSVLGASGIGLEGAFAEGQVKSAVDGAAGEAHAQSMLELLFQVDSESAAFVMGATIGATGSGSVKVELSPVTAGTLELPVFAMSVDAKSAGNDGAGKSLDRQGLLSPGQYLMQVEAEADALPGASIPAEAYFTFNFQLSSVPGSVGSGGVLPPVAVPLPPAILGGGGLLALLGLARFIRNRVAA